MPGIAQEIVAAPYTVWIAAVGTAFPLVDAVPPGPWAKLGTSGNLNYDDNGVVVNVNRTYNGFVPAGSTAERKAWPIKEEYVVDVAVADLSPTTFALAMNNATVTTTAASVGVPGTKSIPMYQGNTLATFALLIKGLSSVNDALASQFQIPACYNKGVHKIVGGKKGQPAMLNFSFSVLKDDSADFGLWVDQTAASS